MRDNKLFLKECPRCNGDMYLDRDYYGQYKMCFQCGYVMELGVQTASAEVQTKAAA